MIRRYIIILMSCTVLVCPVHAENTGKRKPFKGFGIYYTQFKALCAGIQDDGRLEKFLSVVKAHSERDELCESCRPLLKQFGDSCGSLIKSRKKTAGAAETQTEPPVEEAATGENTDPTPVPTPVPYILQREPSALVIDRVARLFGKIAADDDINVRSLPVIQKLVFMLRDKNLFSTGSEADYFDILAEYIGAHFNDVHGETEAGDGAHETPEEKEKNLGVLFDE